MVEQAEIEGDGSAQGMAETRILAVEDELRREYRAIDSRTSGFQSYDVVYRLARIYTHIDNERDEDPTASCRK